MLSPGFTNVELNAFCYQNLSQTIDFVTCSIPLVRPL